MNNYLIMFLYYEVYGNEYSHRNKVFDYNKF